MCYAGVLPVLKGVKLLLVSSVSGRKIYTFIPLKRNPTPIGGAGRLLSTRSEAEAPKILLTAK